MSDYSNVASATVIEPPPDAPSNLTSAYRITNNTGYTDLTWTDSSNNETGFKIYQSINGEAYSEVATVGANTTFYTLNLGAKPTAGDYMYKIVAYNGTGNSSETVTAGTISVTAPPPPQIKLDNASSVYSYGIALDSNGSVVIAGEITGTIDFILAKMTSGLAMSFDSRINCSNNGNDFGNDIAIDSENNIFITGYSYNGTNNDIAIVKMDSGGTKLWDYRFNSSNNGSDEGHGITVDNGGNVFVTGFSYVGSYKDMIVIKLANNGTRLWEKRYSSSSGYLMKAMILLQIILAMSL